jgi:hypothetical protein
MVMNSLRTKRPINTSVVPWSFIAAAHAIVNLFSSPLFAGTHYSCRRRVLLLRGISQGLPTTRVAAELGGDGSTVLASRRRRHAPALAASPHEALTAQAVETAEMFGRRHRRGTLIDHWDGSAWTILPGPAVSGMFYGVTAVAANDVSAVDSSYYYGPTLTEHWDGSVWSVVPSPNPYGAGQRADRAGRDASQ